MLQLWFESGGEESFKIVEASTSQISCRTEVGASRAAHRCVG